VECIKTMMAAQRYESVTKSKSDIVRLLISKGSDVNASCYPLINGKRTSKFTGLLLPGPSTYGRLGSLGIHREVIT
jgi:hypothetical protein